MENTIERHDIANTPFGAIHHVEKDLWQIILGGNIICSKEFKTFEDAEKYVQGIDEFPWDLIINATTLFMKYLQQEEQKQNKTK